jgi:hypothetical protein
MRHKSNTNRKCGKAFLDIPYIFGHHIFDSGKINKKYELKEIKWNTGF